MKQELSDNSLLLYNPKAPVVLHCDASAKGVGAALLQPGPKNTFQPVAYASKSLTSAEQMYACIERELLAIVFATKRFHTYLYGRHFFVHTDHRPLEMIMSKPITSAPPRLQRMLIALAGYNMTIKYLPGKDNQLADGLSRLPNPQNSSQIDLDMRVSFSTNKIEKLQYETHVDGTLQRLQDVIINGWPDSINELPVDIRCYYSFRDELSIENGIITKGQQVVIPQTMQLDITSQLHTAHLGKEKTKLLARETVFWLTMNKDIDQLIDQCKVCQEHQKSQQAEPLMQHDIPAYPWSVVGTDLFEIKGQHYLIVADYYSKYPIVRQIDNNRSAAQIIKLLANIFSEFGTPDKVVSDNGPQYSSREFHAFAESWGFVHTTSSPNRPQGNGFIDRQIQTVKKVMMKTHAAGNNIQQALLHLRITPIDRNMPSPAKMIFGRQIKSSILSKVTNTLAEKEEIHDKLAHRQQSQKHQFDKHARRQNLPTLLRDQFVLIQDPRNQRWERATIHNTTSDTRSYVVRTANGTLVRRNRQHIREIPNTELVPPTAIVPAANTNNNDSSASISRATPSTSTASARQEPGLAQEHQLPDNVYRTRSGRASRKPQRYGGDGS